MTVKEWGEAVIRSMSESVKGQEGTVEQMLVCLLARGHVLLEGVPGLAKTLLAKELAFATGAECRRVQFTPDLMPSDLTGVRVFQGGGFELMRGPVFTPFLLADEINRSPPKTQAALLQAMEERHVSIDGEDHMLAPRFFVIATQNPVEQEGTYPLPEAQLDRFLMKVALVYPSPEAELDMLRLHNAGFNPHQTRVAAVPPTTPEMLLSTEAEVSAVKVEEKVLAYILQIVQGTRRSPQLLLGASPRAAVAVLAASKALAALRGRDYCIPDDVKDVALPALRHRLIVRPEAELEGLTPDRYLQSHLQGLTVPR
ncbi:MAG: MoxR family ATPase [Proteobacteria bacterium]|nr:MoxR family ATPase [Pseudomonadota bacterium]